MLRKTSARSPRGHWRCKELKPRLVGRYRFLVASDVEPVRRRKRKPVQFTFRMGQKTSPEKAISIWVYGRRETSAGSRWR
jgi:hypothetical protein